MNTANDVMWHHFCSVADSFRDKPAIIDAATGHSLTFKELKDQALQVAEVIDACPQRALAFIGEPELRWLPLVFACAATRRTFIPLDGQLPVTHLLQALGVLPGEILVASKLGVGKLPFIDLNRSKALEGLCFQHATGPGNGSPFQPFLVTHSSGSTGRPKPVAFSQSTKLKRTAQSESLFGVTASDVILSPTPLHHSLGQRHFFLAMTTGATLIKAFPFSPRLWLESVRKYQVSFAIPVSTHLKLLQREITREPSALDSFRCMVTSSASSDPGFKRTLAEDHEFDFWEIYGMTETACATAVKFSTGDDFGHVGAALPGSSIRIASDAGEGGEIEILSDCICDGYWGDGARWRDAQTFDGFFKSGDLGRFDDNGNLVFLGRFNESFESFGLTVFPAEVERALLEMRGLNDCIVFGMPDPVFGNLVAVACMGDEGLRKEDIAAWARSRLPKHMWPARLFMEGSFPTLPSGKVDRQRLVAMHLLH